MLRSAGAMGVATLFSRIMGLVREQVFAVMFGAGNLTDAYNIAFRIPNLLRDLFAEGALSSALVPTFTRVRAEQGDRAAWRVAGLVFRTLFVIVATLAILGIVFANRLVGIYAAAFKQIPGKFELTVRMTQIMFPFFPLVALAAAYMGILNACGRFFVPAFASALFNLFSIVVGVSVSYFLPRFGVQPIVGMSVGVIAGGMIQAFYQLPLLYRVGYRWFPHNETLGDVVWHKNPALRTMLVLMIPGTIGLAATQINVLVNSVLATSQGPGAVSWLNYAFRLMQFPIGIFGVSLAAATLPRVSRQWVEKDVSGVAQTLTQSLKNVFAVNLPASAGLAFLGAPIVQLLFEYGRFSTQDTHATAMALAAYSVGLTAYSAVKVLVPACYALGRTRIAVVSSVLSVSMTIVLNLALIGPLGYLGLALGTSAAATFNAIFLCWTLKKLLPDFSFSELARSFFTHFCTAAVMGILCWFSATGLARVVHDDCFYPHLGRLGIALVRAAKMGLLMVEGVAVIVLLAKIFRLTELTEVLDLFTKKLKKKLGRQKI